MTAIIIMAFVFFVPFCPTEAFRLASRDNPDDLDSISLAQLATRKLGRRNRLAIVFHYDAARQHLPVAQELFKGSRQVRGDALAVGDDDSRRHIRSG
jgi:hypothetical protein